MENSTNSKNINYPLLAFIVLQLVFIIAAIISIVPLLNKSDKIAEGDYAKQPSITIDNLTQAIPNFPSDSTEELQHILLNIIQVNDPDVNLANTKAEIRDGGVFAHYFPLPNLNYVSALVDIPEIGQSYQVFLQFSDDEYNENLDPNDSIVFLCITNPAHIIYPDFDCTDVYNQKTRNAITAKFLSYFEFNDFAPIYYSDNDSNDIEISPYTFEELDSSTKESYIQQVKDAIASLGISPDIFTYRVMNPEEIRYYYPLR